MKIERNENQVVINLSQDEIVEIQRGRTVVERGGILPDTKVEVLPLSSVRTDASARSVWTYDRLEQAQSAPLFTELLSNQDLRIVIPAIVLSDVRLSGRTISRDEVEVAGNSDGLRATIPPNGIRINFGGSLKFINTTNSFY